MGLKPHDPPTVPPSAEARHTAAKPSTSPNRSPSPRSTTRATDQIRLENNRLPADVPRFAIGYPQLRSAKPFRLASIESTPANFRTQSPWCSHAALDLHRNVGPIRQPGLHAFNVFHTDREHRFGPCDQLAAIATRRTLRHHYALLHHVKTLFENFQREAAVQFRSHRTQKCPDGTRCSALLADHFAKSPSATRSSNTVACSPADSFTTTPSGVSTSALAISSTRSLRRCCPCWFSTVRPRAGLFRRGWLRQLTASDAGVRDERLDGCAPFLIQCSIRSWFNCTWAGLAIGL